MSDRILVLNCGSSSIKFALFDAATLPRAPPWGGKAVNIGSANAVFEESGAAAAPLASSADGAYRAALARIRERVRECLGDDRLVAVAHRVVHGGAKYFDPVRVDAAVLADLRSYVPLAPLHQPFALEAIAELLATQPQLPQVACFDTGFHRDMPAVEQMLPLPRALREQGLRRYGFHGLSYEYLALALGERHGERARGRTVCAHLGSGASLCAMQKLASVATTMGFSALDGLMMNTRCGALDPGVVIHLMQIRKLTLEDVGHMLYHDSGLLGVSGISADPRVLLAREGEEPAREALDLYVQRLVREIGALAAVLGGLELLAFTAGVGEHRPEIRERACARLGFLGVEIDAAANAANAPVISTSASRVLVVVEPTNEEWIAARAAARLL
ncbi:MAG: acetate/propionate family kinase [Proteobacteria bacterium]|nr:acetate/propionate family kinase [Pseudomonadota bacterium]